MICPNITNALKKKLWGLEGPLLLMAYPSQCSLGPQSLWWSTINIIMSALQGIWPLGNPRVLGCYTYMEGPGLGQKHWRGKRHWSGDEGWRWESSGRNLVEEQRMCFCKYQKLPLNLCPKLPQKENDYLRHGGDDTGRCLWRHLWNLWLVLLKWRG